MVNDIYRWFFDAAAVVPWRVSALAEILPFVSGVVVGEAAGLPACVICLYRFRNRVIS